jgi:serine/threonine protein kinase
MDLTKIRDVMEHEQLTFCPKCQFPLVLIAGKYQLDQILRRGGCSVVYLANHVHLDRDPERVIKIIRPEFFTIKGMSTRFRREVQLTATLSQHNEHIVRIFDDFGEIPNIGHFYVMEYLQGSPLSSMLKDPALLPSLSFCFHLFSQLCETMQFAHEEGVVHRDLKPDNLMLVKRKKEPYFLKVLDFGIAKPMSNEELPGGTHVTQGSLGTPAYMAPEQCLNQPTDARTDIYSMGVILYELLTGRTPFLPPQGEHSAYTSVVGVIEGQITRPPPSPRELRPDRVSPELESIILKALAKKPQDRFQSMNDFRDALGDIISALPALGKEDVPHTTPLPLSAAAPRNQALLTSELEQAFMGVSLEDVHRSQSPDLPQQSSASTKTKSANTTEDSPSTDTPEAKPEAESVSVTAPAQEARQATDDKESKESAKEKPDEAEPKEGDKAPPLLLTKPKSTPPPSSRPARQPASPPQSHEESPILETLMYARQRRPEAQPAQTQTPKANPPNKQAAPNKQAVPKTSAKTQPAESAPEPLAPQSIEQTMGSALLECVDRIQGPRNGVLSLFLTQRDGWDSEPAGLEELRETIHKLNEFGRSDSFRALYPGCRGKVVLEAFAFPRHVVDYLTREEVELRVLPRPSSPPTPAPAKSGNKPQAPKQQTSGASHKAKKTQQPAKQTAPAGQKAPVRQNGTHAKKSPTNGATRSAVSASAGQSGLQKSTPKKESTPPPPKVHVAKEATPASSSAASALPNVPTPVAVWEQIDDYEPVTLPSNQLFSPGMLFVGLVFLLSLFGLGYGMFGMSDSPNPHAQLRVVRVENVSAAQQPKASYVQVSLRPDRSTFTIVPIQNRQTGKTEVFVLFASRENRRLLVYAPQAQSQILQQLREKMDPNQPGETKTIPVWSPDLRKPGNVPDLRSYVGTLEQLQRRKNGPLELVLPDENRNINKIRGFVRAGIQFPLDSMVLLVGQKPKLPENHRSTVIWLSLLMAVMAGGIFFSVNQRNQRAF